MGIHHVTKRTNAFDVRGSLRGSHASLVSLGTMEMPSTEVLASVRRGTQKMFS